MKPAWAADIEVDAALAARLIAAQFPQLDITRIVPYGLGWDNVAFLADGVVFRFPRRQIAVGLIAREIVVLPLLAPALPLAIPAPRFVGRATDAYPWPFAGYPLIAGTTACALPLSDDVRAALARPLAEFLRALHALDPTPLVACGLPGDEMGRLDPGKRLRMTRDKIASLRDGDAIANGAAIVDWLEAHPPVALEPQRRRVVHGDLYARHLVLDATARPVGVIDWGDVHLGDPAIDLAIAHLMLPATAHAAFRAAYGPIDERTWDAARYRALYHAVVEIDYGIRANDAAMHRIGNAALRLMR